MQKVVFATHNTHKIQEMGKILEDYPFAWASLADFSPTPEPDENGATYLDNALLKARAACSQIGLPCLADDSGLEVMALGGAPGLHSARFGGPGATQCQKIDLLLDELRSTTPRIVRTREARFRCVVALAHPDGREWWNEAICPGCIADRPQGLHGFGYDPIFFLPQHGKTMAELSDATKNRISHRALALFGLMNRIFESSRDYPQL